MAILGLLDSAAEAAAQLAWEQAIEASRPNSRDDAEEEETAGACPAAGGGGDP